MDGQSAEKKSIKLLPIESLETDLQVRSVCDPVAIGEYAKAMKELKDRREAGDEIDPSEEFPPVVVYLVDGEEFHLVDGYHRVDAAEKNGEKDIKCDIRTGTLADALEYAITANMSHGIRMNREDRRKAVAMALEQFPSRSDRAIATLCGVSPSTVGKVRAEQNEVSKLDTWDEQNQVSKLDTSTAETEAPTRTGKDGKSYPATQPPRTAAPAESDSVGQIDQLEDEPADIQAELPESDYPADEDDFSPSVCENKDDSPAPARTSGLTPDRSAHKVVESTVPNGAADRKPAAAREADELLNKVGRRLQELGLFKKHQHNLSAMIKDVREAGGLDKLPIKGEAAA